LIWAQENIKFKHSRTKGNRKGGGICVGFALLAKNGGETKDQEGKKKGVWGEGAFGEGLIGAKAAHMEVS